jgi:hypothetical protein
VSAPAAAPIEQTQDPSAVDAASGDDPDAASLGSAAPGTDQADRDRLARAADARQIRPASVAAASASSAAWTRPESGDLSAATSTEPAQSSIELA